MSTTHYVYIGPYLRCESSIRGDHIREVESTTPDVITLFNSIEQRLTIPESIETYGTNEHYWIPNMTGVGVEYSHYDVSSVAPITTDRITSEIAEFNAQYADVLEKVYAAYGEGRVQLLWGVVHYYA